MNVMTIFGPPGTGKTRQLVEFAKTEGGGLFLSYTRAAAAEAVSRLNGRYSVKPSTIHSLAFNGLGMNRAAVVDRDKITRFSIDTGIPFKGTERDSDEDQEGDEYAAAYSYSRNRMITTDEAYEHMGCPGTRMRWIHFLQTYQSWKEEYGFMDFDDMLTAYSRSGHGKAEVVFLDEAQDCTPLQWNVFAKICENAKRVYVAGDDDQAIYEWNGADPHGMANFNEQHRGEMMILAHSHRLPHAVWQVAMRVIETVERRVPKAFQHTGLDGEVLRYGELDLVLRNLSVNDKALILVRDQFKLGEVKKALNRDLLPYQVLGGVSPWTSKIATALRNKEKPDIPLVWRDFYAQADLSLPINLSLSTIHSAKGREHDTVILDLDCPARVLRGVSVDRDPEVRVQYVGLTRSKGRLLLCGNNPIV